MTKIAVRAAGPDDADDIARLVRGLDHQLAADQVRANLAVLDRERLPQLVAIIDGRLAGVAGLDRMQPIYRPKPVARITILIVEESFRGSGVGKALVEHAVGMARGWGCGMIEVTSNDRLEEAHNYYRHLGFVQTSRRFCMAL